MGRWKTRDFEVPARTMVNIILVRSSTSICEVKCNKEQKAELGVPTFILCIPNDNFAGDKIKKADRKNKKAVNRPAKVLESTAETTLPVVEVEPAAETPAPVVETAGEVQAAMEAELAVL